MALQMRGASASGRGSFLNNRIALKSQVAPVAVRSRIATPTAALFGFGGGKKTEAGATPYYICIDCGFIYDGDFKSAPSNYKCPACKAPKSRFKVYKGKVSGRPANSSAAIQKRKAEKQW